MNEEDKMIELSKKALDDYLYMYNYNIGLVRDIATANRTISNLGKLLVDDGIRRAELEESRNNWCHWFGISVAINILTIGALCLL